MNANNSNRHPQWLFCLVTCVASSATPLALFAAICGKDVPYGAWLVCALLTMRAMDLSAGVQNRHGLATKFLAVFSRQSRSTNTAPKPRSISKKAIVSSTISEKQ